MKKIKNFFFYNLPGRNTIHLLIQIAIVVGAGLMVWRKTHDWYWTTLVVLFFLK